MRAASLPAMPVLQMARQRGFVVIVSLLVLSLLFTLSAVATSRSLTELNVAARYVDLHRALEISEGAVDNAIEYLAANGCKTTKTVTIIIAGKLTPTVSTTCVDQPVFKTTTPLNTMGGGTYTVTATKLANNVNVVAPNQLWKLSSTATFNNLTRKIDAVVKATPKSVFQFALFGSDGLTVNGMVQTDSYDSALGPYGVAGNVNIDGNIGTNATTYDLTKGTGLILINSNPAYNTETGAIYVGDPNALYVQETPNTTPPNLPPEVAGMPYPSAGVDQVITDTMPMPAVPVPPQCANPPSVTYDGNFPNGDPTQTPPVAPLDDPVKKVKHYDPGVQCFDQVSVKNGAQWIPSDPSQPTTMYVNKLDLVQDAFIGLPAPLTFVTGPHGKPIPDPALFQKPTLTLLFPNTGAALTVSDDDTYKPQATLLAMVLGPDLTVNMGNRGQTFGSIIAKTINIQTGMFIHYDKDLKNNFSFTTGQYDMSIQSWTDKSTLVNAQPLTGGSGGGLSGPGH